MTILLNAITIAAAGLILVLVLARIRGYAQLRYATKSLEESHLRFLCVMDKLSDALDRKALVKPTSPRVGPPIYNSPSVYVRCLTHQGEQVYSHIDIDPYEPRKSLVAAYH